MTAEWQWAIRDDDEPWLEARSFSYEQIADAFSVPAHLVTSDLSPGYWSRQLAREIQWRSLRARVHRFLREIVA